MPALRPRTKIGNDRGPHRVVLRALPEATRNIACRSVRLAELYSAALIQRVANPQGAQAQCLCSITPVETRARPSSAFGFHSMRTLSTLLSRILKETRDGP